MKLPNPIHSTDKTNRSTNHLFYSALVSGSLTLMACTILIPKTRNHAVNYTDPHQHAADQSGQDRDPGYNWFY
jgi:hypothetical protein